MSAGNMFVAPQVESECYELISLSFLQHHEHLLHQPFRIHLHGSQSNVAMAFSLKQKDDGFQKETQRMHMKHKRSAHHGAKSVFS